MPRYSVGPLASFDGLTTSIVQDLYNACGVAGNWQCTVAPTDKELTIFRRQLEGSQQRQMLPIFRSSATSSGWRLTPSSLPVARTLNDQTSRVRRTYRADIAHSYR